MLNVYPDQLTGGDVTPPDERSDKVQEDVLSFGTLMDPEFLDLTLNSPHQVSYDGNIYPTALHLYEAMKYLPDRPHFAEFIRTHDIVFLLSMAYQFDTWRRQDWDEVAAEKLDEVLWLKFTQNAHLKDLLLQQTGDKELRFIDMLDLVMGCSSTGDGRNELGKGLMRLRDRLRKEEGMKPCSSESPVEGRV